MFEGTTYVPDQGSNPQPIILLMICNIHGYFCFAYQGNIESEKIELPLETYEYLFENLEVGYEYTFTVAAVNNIGEGEPYGLGQFIHLPATGKSCFNKTFIHFQNR